MLNHLDRFLGLVQRQKTLQLEPWAMENQTYQTCGEVGGEKGQKVKSLESKGTILSIEISNF